MTPAPDGFVLAGGHSTRMGFDKARAPWHGEAMATVVLATLSKVCGRVALIRRGPPDGLPWVDAELQPLEVLREADDGPPHPLWGVVTALRAASGEWAVVVPCDVPAIRAASLQRLVAAAPAVAMAPGRRHPLIGVFPTSWASDAQRAASAGEAAGAFAERAREVEVAASELTNVNRATDLPEGPVAGLRRRLSFLDDEAMARAVEGERGRLSARGMLDPETPRGYVPLPPVEGA